jgi:hypothetical protein
MVAVVGGEKCVHLFDFFEGSVWKTRLEVIESVCSDCKSNRGESSFELVLGSEKGHVVLYQVSVKLEKRKIENCEIKVLDEWNVSQMDEVSFGDGFVLASCAGSVVKLYRGGNMKTVRNEEMEVPSKTKILNNNFVNVTMDGYLVLFNEKNEPLCSCNLLKSSNCTLDVIFSFKTSDRALRVGGESAVICCSWSGNTWLIDEKGNVLFFQLDLDKGSIMAFHIFKNAEGDSYIAYITTTGKIVMYAMDLTCIECRLFSHHAHKFVKDHPFWGGLNAKQSAQLINFAMNKN